MHNILLQVNLPNSSGWRNTELFHLSIMLVHLYMYLVLYSCSASFFLPYNRIIIIPYLFVLYCTVYGWMPTKHFLSVSSLQFKETPRTASRVRHLLFNFSDWALWSFAQQLVASCPLLITQQHQQEIHFLGHISL